MLKIHQRMSISVKTPFGVFLLLAGISNRKRVFKQLNYNPVLFHRTTLWTSRNFNCCKAKILFPTRNRDINAKYVRSTTMKQNYILFCQNLYVAVQNLWLKWLWFARKMVLIPWITVPYTFLLMPTCNPVLQFPSPVFTSFGPRLFPKTTMLFLFLHSPASYSVPINMSFASKEKIK